MGITIESYRINIGIFNNRHPKKYKIQKTSNSNFNLKFNKKFKTFLLLLTIFLLIIQSNNFYNKATFYRKGQASCLDHIYSNCHTRIKNVTIEKDILSDHKIITCSYNNKKLNLSTSYKTKRDFSLITTESLLHYLNTTNNIDQVFNTNDPNKIADILINEVD